MRGRLVAFAEEMLAPLARSDQRRWGEVYLRGLMLDGRRKSIEPMAARLADGDEQCLQQFVNQSPWAWEPVRERLARRMSAAIAPEAWIVDDTGFPKFGRDSVGVARQYCGALGKVGNCQVGVSINAATDEACCPLDWRLFLPAEWDDDQSARAKAHVPPMSGHRPKWRLALEMIDELRDWGLEPAGRARRRRLWRDHRVPARPGGARAGLRRAGQGQRPPPTPQEVRPERAAYAGVGPPAEAALPAGALLAASAGPGGRPRGGGRGRLARGLARRAALALRGPARATGQRRPRAAPPARAELPLAWLLCEWPEGDAEPIKYWLSNLPAETTLTELVRLAKLRWRIEHDYRELKDALGLDHFEGRSYHGWHHHVTLVSLAHAFLTLATARPKSRMRRPDPLRAPARAATLVACWTGACPTCRRRLPRRDPLPAPARTNLTEHY